LEARWSVLANRLMATMGRTLFRFTGALLLGASATSIDNPNLLLAPTRSQAPPPERQGAGLEVKITPGKRAFGIRINDLAAFGDMIQPNSRVDIVVVINDPDRHKQVAKLFLENMRVLAIGAVTERVQDGQRISAGVASIEVTPQEAEKLAIAAAKGPLVLVLRGYGEPNSISTKDAVLNPFVLSTDPKSRR